MDEMQAAPQEQAAQGEDAIVDQIGQLLNQLSPEKQQEVVAQLAQMMGGAEPADQGTIAADAGPNGVPYQGV